MLSGASVRRVYLITLSVYAVIPVEAPSVQTRKPLSWVSSSSICFGVQTVQRGDYLWPCFGLCIPVLRALQAKYCVVSSLLCSSVTSVSSVIVVSAYWLDGQVHSAVGAQISLALVHRFLWILGTDFSGSRAQISLDLGHRFLWILGTDFSGSGAQISLDLGHRFLWILGTDFSGSGAQIFLAVGYILLWLLGPPRLLSSDGCRAAGA
jgi:hypothetical protein